MSDNEKRDGEAGRLNTSQSEAPGGRPSRRRRLRLAAGMVLLAGITLAVLHFSGLLPWSREVPFEAELRVTVRSAKDAGRILRLDEAGALPVRAGDEMSLQVHFNQPAHTYLVWINSEGQVVPLYPWNMDSIEVEDANEPPPACRAAKAVLNPMTIGKGWQFGKPGGLETVLLLARRTPLEPGVKLGKLLGSLPAAKMRQRDELFILGLDPGAKSVATLVALNRGAPDEARAADEPLRVLLARLHEHFELIRAVRFAHDEN